MMKKTTLYLTCILCALGFTETVIAQEWGGNAYMKGDYVEVGISEKGREGAEEFIGDSTFHFRGGVGTHPWGFVANPQMDGWDEYNGDFFTPGTPECGIGLTYTLLGTTYNKGNNYDIFEIPGEITDYTSTVDSVLVTWTGMIDSLQVTLLYELQKDELLYTTTVSLTNLGGNTFTDVYYYDNFDPDNNQSIGGTFTTENTIESQSEMADDSVIVSAAQVSPWASEVFQLAYGADWKGAIGGFSNRSGEEIWNGYGFMDTTEGANTIADVAIALAHKTDIITPGKATETTFSYATAFSREAFEGDDGEVDPGVGIAENEAVPFKLFPNPSEEGEVTLKLDGAFTYVVLDARGREVIKSSGSNFVTLSLSDLDKGVYLVQVTQNGNVSTERLVLQ
ncbi:MAG: T9SS type A sorting domain-containing protein [Crocinitomix sp.]|nr:T9SS type A sorting domain-containing protein [Crocinitomix sp.]